MARSTSEDEMGTSREKNQARPEELRRGPSFADGPVRAMGRAFVLALGAALATLAISACAPSGTARPLPLSAADIAAGAPGGGAASVPDATAARDVLSAFAHD